MRKFISAQQSVFEAPAGVAVHSETDYNGDGNHYNNNLTGLELHGGTSVLSGETINSSNLNVSAEACSLSVTGGSVLTSPKTGLYAHASRVTATAEVKAYTGVQLDGCTLSTIQNSTLHGGTGYPCGTGILLAASQANVTNNTITAVSACVNATGGGQATVRANTFNLSHTGLRVYNSGSPAQDLTLNCNVFTPDAAATTAYGLYVSGSTTVLNDIGGDGLHGIYPGGNIWPISTSSRSNTFTQYSSASGWNSPSGWYSIYNAGAVSFKYYSYKNEYYGQFSSSGVISRPSPTIEAATEFNVAQVCTTAFGTSAACSVCIAQTMLYGLGAANNYAYLFNSNGNNFSLVCNNINDYTVYFPMRSAAPADTIKRATGLNFMHSKELLGCCIPNPANNETSVTYSFPEESGKAAISVIETASGRLLAAYDLGATASGNLLISTEKLPPGFYSVRLSLNGAVAATRKLVIVK